MPKHALIEIDEVIGKDQRFNDVTEKKADIALYDVKRYDRDALGLPPVFIFRANEHNESENIGRVLDKKIDDVKAAFALEHEEFICFRETKQDGLQRVTYQKPHMDMTPSADTIINKISVKAEDIDKELARGMDNLYSAGLKKEMQQKEGLNQGTPSLDDAFFSEKKKTL